MARWFRHYVGMMRDAKLVGAALKSGQTIERVVWVWGAILESASEIDDAGRYEIDTAEIAYFLRADEADIQAIVAALEALGRLDGGRVAKWSDRQYQSDRSADRQARYRQRKRENGNAGNYSATSGDDGVTSPSRHRDAPDTDTDTDNISPLPPLGEEEIVFEAWNSEAEQSGLPAAKVLSSERRRALKARIKEHGLDGVLEAVKKIHASPHCRGQNDRAWKADFEFLLQAKSCRRAREGGYDSQPRAGPLRAVGGV